MYNIYYENGVVITPNVLAEGDRAKVTYKGLLFNSGADSISMHIGYGNDWTKSTDIQMSKSKDGFEATLPIASHDMLKVAFKDSAGNWDNNSGRNYSFEVQTRK